MKYLTILLALILAGVPLWAAPEATSQAGALGEGKSPDGALDDAAGPLFYLFSTEALGYPADVISARFEYRSGDRVLGADEILIDFGDAATLLVPFPRPLSNLSPDHPLQDLRIMVFAGDLLLSDFDHRSLLAYNRGLQYTHKEVISPPSRSLDGVREKIYCDSPCGGGCGPWEDYDCDGVSNFSDNCNEDYNPGQQDCDGDGRGNVCDVINGVFQATGPVKTCMTDKDDHVIYFTFEHHVEQRQVDVSSCGSPDRWNRWVRSDTECFNLTDWNCCANGIGASIEQVGDDLDLWCGSSRRNIDFCH